MLRRIGPTWPAGRADAGRGPRDRGPADYRARHRRRRGTGAGRDALSEVGSV